ncbi:PAAR domain-containing protein [Amycolatopsis anabasis]|uniref:PAAR domain-containing protein n=1 Tax=Amycolatopsis anabasis TaxID=1840409 RepID=UPI00131D64CF|nr:PAAR domain-containing protein [Amycolatopsis anabasis]
MSPAAKQGDQVVGTDIHIVLVPTPGGPVPTPTPLPFNGILTGGCSPNVLVGGAPAATVGSTATNSPPHIPPGGPFQIPPTNTGVVVRGSATVLINGKPAARAGDTVNTCNDPAPAPTSSIVATSTVQIGP